MQLKWRKFFPWHFIGNDPNDLNNLCVSHPCRGVRIIQVEHRNEPEQCSGPHHVFSSLWLRFVLSVWSIPLLPLRLHCRHSGMLSSVPVEEPSPLLPPSILLLPWQLAEVYHPLCPAAVGKPYAHEAGYEWLWVTSVCFFCFPSRVDYRFG